MKMLLMTCLLASMPMFASTQFSVSDPNCGKPAFPPCCKPDPTPCCKPLVQMAILLDTSGSMEGLIEQAKTQLWRIVNEFSRSKRHGHRPELQVALYEYGKASIPAQEGYLRMILPLTTDLDKVSEQLFALRTNGGEEYCGRAIQAAVNGLCWSQSGNDLKTIFIAGNEPFTQGNVDYREACRAAIAKGIVVNTIHCGSIDEGIQGQWKDGADRSEGKFFCIDHNVPLVRIETPHDGKIAMLGMELNKTYLPYGSQGEVGYARQKEQDKNAGQSAPAVAAERAATKGSALYVNSTWDLVDAFRDKKVKLDELKDSELPQVLKNMKLEERKSFIEAQLKEREKIQAEIVKLNEERNRYIAEKQKEAASGGKDTLDVAIIKAIRELAQKKSLEFEK